MSIICVLGLLISTVSMGRRRLRDRVTNSISSRRFFARTGASFHLVVSCPTLILIMLMLSKGGWAFMRYSRPGARSCESKLYSLDRSTILADRHLVEVMVEVMIVDRKNKGKEKSVSQ